jgi:Ca2+-binding RTX toxin-like protein
MADRLWGGPGGDVLEGLNGRDRLYGQTGPDRLVGGPKEDLLFGGRGRDDLDARDGERDSLDGGSGIDTGRWDRGLDRVEDVERHR